MDPRTLSRRLLVSAPLLAAVSPLRAHSVAATLTAQAIDRIKANVGVPWRQQTVDNIIAGTADTVVKGIARTVMATLDVLERASAAGRNLVITHELKGFLTEVPIEFVPAAEPFWLP